MNNIIYQAVSKITEQREANGNYHSNGHHLAQEIIEAVEAELKASDIEIKIDHFIFKRHSSIDNILWMENSNTGEGMGLDVNKLWSNF
jgi:hypothetical protein